MTTMLRQVVAVLDDHGIDYWLDRGTLLGAWRNGNIIPGDSDIDLRVMWRDWRRIQAALESSLPEFLEVVVNHHGATVHPPDNDHDTPWFRNDDGEFPVADDYGMIDGVFHHCPTAITVVTRGQSIYRKPNVDLYSCRVNSHHCCMRSDLARPWEDDGEEYYVLPAGREPNIFTRASLVRPLGRIAFVGGEYSAPAEVERYLEWLFGYLGENAVRNPETKRWEPAPSAPSGKR